MLDKDSYHTNRVLYSAAGDGQPLSSALAGTAELRHRGVATSYGVAKHASSVQVRLQDLEA